MSIFAINAMTQARTSFDYSTLLPTAATEIATKTLAIAYKNHERYCQRWERIRERDLLDRPTMNLQQFMTHTPHRFWRLADVVFITELPGVPGRSLLSSTLSELQRLMDEEHPEWPTGTLWHDTTRLGPVDASILPFTGRMWHRTPLRV